MNKISWKWLGKREFIPGCPARDLSDEELDERGIRHLVEVSPKYKKVLPKKQTKKEKE